MEFCTLDFAVISPAKTLLYTALSGLRGEIHALTANSSLTPHSWAIVDSSGGYPWARSKLG